MCHHQSDTPDVSSDSPGDGPSRAGEAKRKIEPNAGRPGPIPQPHTGHASTLQYASSYKNQAVADPDRTDQPHTATILEGFAVSVANQLKRDHQEVLKEMALLRLHQQETAEAVRQETAEVVKQETQPGPSKIGQTIKREPVLASQVVPLLTLDPALFVGAVTLWGQVGEGPMPPGLFGVVFGTILAFHLIAALFARGAVTPVTPTSNVGERPFGL